MSKVPVPSSTGVPENHVLRLHTSPGAFKSNNDKKQESVFDDSLTDSDTSGIYFPPSNKRLNTFRYSGDNEYSSDEETNKICDKELSVELNSLAGENFQRSPYLLRSSLSRSNSPEPSTSGETQALVDTSTDESKKSDVKRKRKSLGPKDFPKGSLIEKDSGFVFPKLFKSAEPYTSTFPLQPIVEYDEETASENRLIESDQFPINDQKQIERTLKSVGDEPYVLNINLLIHKEFSDKDVPVIVNINNQSDYSYQSTDDGVVSSNVSFVSSGAGIFGDDIGSIRNSTLVNEVEDPAAEITMDQPIEATSEEHLVITAPFDHPIEAASLDQLIPQIASEDNMTEAHLENLTGPNSEATVPISVKVEEDLNNPKPGPSKPASRKTNKDAPKKTNPKKNSMGKGNSDNKAQTKKSQEDKTPASKAQKNKTKENKNQQGKALEGKPQQGKVQRGKAKESNAQEGNVKEDNVHEGKARQGKARQGKNQKAPTRCTKRVKEVGKKKLRGRKEQQRPCAHTKGKQRRHPKVHKRCKKCGGIVVKMACRHKHTDSSSDSDSSDGCSVCSGEFCKSSSSSSSESSSCCDSTSSSCSCSCCEHSSDDYDSSD